MFPYISIHTVKELNKFTKGTQILIDKLYFNTDEKVYFKVNTKGFLRVYKNQLSENLMCVTEEELDKDCKYHLIEKNYYSLDEFKNLFKDVIII